MRGIGAWLLTLSAVLVAQAPAVPLDADALSGLKARCIGPAVMSGRISALDGAVVDGRIHLYVGAASGGVWKSVNGGTTYKPIFDKYCPSIGAIKLDPKRPKTVWVGTGEGWVRNSVSAGDGIYRSDDGGDSWKHLGLKDTERIVAIEVSPEDPNTVFAAAQGPLFQESAARGVFKTSDGGKTWRPVLQVDGNTGCAALVMDPSNPKRLFAAMWQHRRTPWSFSSGGPGSGLYRSEDGGETWVNLSSNPKHGLPTGQLGRIALAMTAAKPGRVYATVEAADGGLYRSEDNGATWVRGNAGAEMVIRPFYFALLVADPKQADRVYKPGLFLSISEDAGRSFDTRGRSTHADHHALWIDPTNSEHLFLGTDGGMFESGDGGRSWRMHGGLPIAQFYHVAVDQSRPYRVFGGLQDNSTWMGFSAVNLANKHWTNLYGGDGFWALPDPSDPAYVYAESQGGNAARIHIPSKTSRSIKPTEGPTDPKFRWNWNTPLGLSPHHPRTLYMGAQFLFRSRDNGASWERISPDLTSNDPAKQNQTASGGVTVDNSSAETHCTLYTLSESPKRADLLWVGTDDGNLQLTRNGGKTWTNLAPKIPGVPSGTWVSWVEASPHAEGTAFVAFDGHMRGDTKPYAYRTDDGGTTWKSLADTGLAGSVHVIKQDPVNPDLLFAGTEMGLYFSMDGGGRWLAFQGGLPRVPVRDLVIHPREHDLVVATHGRGIWIIDDLTPLRALTPELLAKDLVLLPTRPNRMLEQYTDSWASGDDGYIGQGPTQGVVITTWQKKRHMVGSFTAEILNDKGEVLTTLIPDKRRGLASMVWNGQARAPRVPKSNQMSYAGFMGPRMPEGTYTVRMNRNGETVSGPVTLLPDPSSPHTREDREARLAATLRAFRLMEDMAFTVQQILHLRDACTQALQEHPEAPAAAAHAAMLQAAEKHRAVFVPVSEARGITGEEKLREALAEIYAAINSERGRPSPSQLERLKTLEHQVQAAIQTWNRELATLLAPVRAAQTQAGKPVYQPLTRADWEAQTRP